MSAGNVTAVIHSPPISAALAFYDRFIGRQNGNGVFTMNNVSAKTAKKTSQEERKARKSPDSATALHQQYGQIGISAVAAAVRYQGEAKNSAYAPVSTGRRAAVNATSA